MAEHALATGYRGSAPEALVYGSVAEVTDQLRALCGMGYTDVIVRHLIDDQPQVLGSLSRLALVRDALRDADVAKPRLTRESP